MRLTPDPAITDMLDALVAATPAPSPRAFMREDFVGLPPRVNLHDVRGSLDEIEDRHGVTDRAAGRLGGVSSGSVIYPAHSCMDWHTNSNRPGQRLYYSYSDGGGVFRYVTQDGRVVDDEEGPGWIARAFVIPEGELFWHTIYAETPRWAFGFLLTTRLG